MTGLKLWGRHSSARTQKVLLALAELGLDFEMILASATMGPDGHVAKGNTAYGVVDTPEYRAMNPTAPCRPSTPSRSRRWSLSSVSTISS